MFSPSDLLLIPFEDWINVLVRDWIVPNFRPLFRALQVPVSMVLAWLDSAFNAVPMLAFTAVLAVIAGRTAGRGMAIFTVVGLMFIDMIGLWPETMTTLSMIVTSVLFCVVLGVPLGIVTARSEKVLAVVRPALDIMQTVPSFVYLVPIVMLFGVGMAPGIIATIVFALPPIVRLTNLGIRNVRGDLIEAAEEATDDRDEVRDGAQPHFQYFFMIQDQARRRIRQRQVGNGRYAQHANAGMPGDYNLRRSRHTDRIPAGDLEEAQLGRCLKAWPGYISINALAQHDTGPRECVHAQGPLQGHYPPAPARRRLAHGGEAAPMSPRSLERPQCANRTLPGGVIRVTGASLC